MIEIKAPNDFTSHLLSSRPSIFLAGSIEMGMAEDWQKKVVDGLKDVNCTILNPRRDDWDPTWVQSKDNPKFREQVEWELNGIESANALFFYFDPNTKSPITLMELGLVAASNHQFCYVCCPEGFWRKGNVDMVCERNDIMMFESLDAAIEYIKG